MIIANRSTPIFCIPNTQHTPLLVKISLSTYVSAYIKNKETKSVYEKTLLSIIWGLDAVFWAISWDFFAAQRPVAIILLGKDLHNSVQSSADYTSILIHVNAQRLMQININRAH